MIQPINTSPSFKSVYRYPANYTQRQENGIQYLTNNILYSEKYKDKKGQTLIQAFDKLGYDIVIYPNGEDGITYRENPKGKPFEPIEEVNRYYPNVTRVPVKTDDEMVEIFNTNLDTLRLTAKAAKREIARIAAGILMSFAALCLVFKACDSESQKKAIQKTVIENNAVKTMIKPALNIFK